MGSDAVGVDNPPDQNYADGHNHLLNVLNEILHGLGSDAPARLHASRESLSALHSRLAEEGAQRKLPQHEMRLLLDALRFCESSLAKPEFGIRLGVSKEQARQTAARLERRAAAAEHLQTRTAVS